MALRDLIPVKLPLGKHLTGQVGQARLFQSPGEMDFIPVKQKTDRFNGINWDRFYREK